MDIAAYFGHFDTEQTLWDYSKNWIFQQNQFPDFAAGLQNSSADGKGAVFNTILTTVNNDYWNIEAGFQVNITVMYLNRVNVL
jgi:hypothetical protein